MPRKSKGIRVVSEEAEKDVTFLTDVDVEFVSLVRHGANQMPFRVVKSEDAVMKGGDTTLRTVIQSIILPKSATLSSVAEQEELQWMVEAKDDQVQEFDDYQKLIQIPVEKFEQESLALVKLHDNGTYAVVGKLESEEDLDDALVLGSREMKSMIPLPAHLADGPLTTGLQVPAYLSTFRQMFEKELMDLLNSINHENADPVARKQSVMGALDAFKTFMSVGLDAIAGTDAAGKSTGDTEGLMLVQEQLTKMQGTIKQALDAENNGGKKTMFQFETKEEFLEAVKSVVSEVIEAKEAKETPKVEDTKTAPEVAPTPDPTVVEMLAQVKSLNDTVQGLVQKTDTLSNAFTSNREPEADPEKKETAKKSIFSGLLTATPKQ